jgi:ADP-heptose:LPS heptosyltransferase
VRLPITVIGVVENDEWNIRETLSLIRPYVDEIILAVQPSFDGSRAACEEFADKVIGVDATIFMEQQFGPLEEMARNEWVFPISADEAIARPEAMVDLLQDGVDAWFFPRLDYLDGKRVQFSAQDPQLRLHRKQALVYAKQMHTYATVPSGKVGQAAECWIEHRRSIEHIRRRQTQYDHEAREHDQSHAIPMQEAFLAKAEGVHQRQLTRKRERILLSYNGTVGIGDTIMTTPAIREFRRLHPDAQIDYLTQQGVVLKNNPYIDRVLDTPPEQWNAKLEDDYDIVVHWETSLTGEVGKRVNGYELGAWWAYVQPENFHGDWFISKHEAMVAKNTLAQHVKTPRVVGMALAASALHRTWQHSVEFAETLLREYDDVTLIFFGDSRCKPLELEHCAWLRPVAEPRDLVATEDGKVKVTGGIPRLAEVPYDGPGKDRIVRTAGRLSLRDACAIIDRLDLLIAPDSGLMHVAAALDKPCVAYFNLVPPELRVKHCPTVTPIEAEWECSPCFVHGRIDCDHTAIEKGAPCLDTITVDRMMGAVENILG